MIAIIEKMQDNFADRSNVVDKKVQEKSIEVAEGTLSHQSEDISTKLLQLSIPMPVRQVFDENSKRSTFEVVSALDVMILLSSKYSQEILSLSSHISGVLDYLEGFDVQSLHKVYEIFCLLAMSARSSAERFASSIANELLMIIRKQVGNPYLKYKKTFKFDRDYTQKDDQVDVFANVSPLVISVLDGYNVCIFGYGQTGTGKTFTMEGTEDNMGVNYRTLEELFNIAKERKETFRYNISVSVLEVDNELVLGNTYIRMKGLESLVDKEKEEISDRELLEANEACPFETLEETEALFLSMYTSFSFVSYKSDNADGIVVAWFWNDIVLVFDPGGIINHFNPHTENILVCEGSSIALLDNGEVTYVLEELRVESDFIQEIAVATGYQDHVQSSLILEDKDFLRGMDCNKWTGIDIYFTS